MAVVFKTLADNCLWWSLLASVVVDLATAIRYSLK